jgi:AraC-like DNA-binding protein
LEGPRWPMVFAAALIPLPFLVLLLRKGWDRWHQNPRHVFSGISLRNSTQDEADFQRVSEVIAARYSDPQLSTSTIHCETGIPEGKISPLLENHTGIRFKAYLNQIRVDEAARLLVESDRSISEIAFLVGYGNTTHFNRVFRGLTKVSPGEFRRLNPKLQDRRAPGLDMENRVSGLESKSKHSQADEESS